MNEFLKQLFEEAKKAGLTNAEAFVLQEESFDAMAMEGEITKYSSNATRGLGFRAMAEGKMGYASTEAFDQEAVRQLVKGALDSARLCEDTDAQFLYDGKGEIPAIELYNPALEEVSPEQKLDFVLRLEKEAKAYDPRIEKVGDTMVFTSKQTVRIVNTHGVDQSYTQNYCGALVGPIAHEGDSTTSGEELILRRSFEELSAKELAAYAAQMAVERLHAKPIASGSYRVILENMVMTDLLGVFSQVFSAENAQQGLSLLKGKLGEAIAADCVTLVDDPLLPGGMASRPFDAEGVPSAKHTVIHKGVFQTFLHNLKTAHKDGVATTGNASKAGYAASVRVSPSNFYFQPGSKTLAEMMQDVGSGVLITDVSGLHAGTDAVSGDFSLLAKGFLLEKGRKVRPLEQITVAGNFFAMLKAIRTMGGDLRFPRGGMGSPSVDVGELSIAGE
ncbi:MAG: TldD/PmbA family protein [Candidatus Limiplasma sp.]|nr:TldD/PmbA family protein [Candidatus Limiplasma sp.]